jgi:hypothetical protein
VHNATFNKQFRNATDEGKKFGQEANFMQIFLSPSFFSTCKLAHPHFHCEIFLRLLESYDGKVATLKWWRRTQKKLYFCFIECCKNNLEAIYRYAVVVLCNLLACRWVTT